MNWSQSKGVEAGACIEGGNNNSTETETIMRLTRHRFVSMFRFFRLFQSSYVFFTVFAGCCLCQVVEAASVEIALISTRIEFLIIYRLLSFIEHLPGPMLEYEFLAICFIGQDRYETSHHLSHF